MTLVFPAPLGPSRPSTSPRATVKETSSTAVWRPYRLRRPGAPDRRGRRQGRRASRARGGGRTVIPRTVAASAEVTGDRQQPRRRSASPGDAGHHAVLDPDHAGEEPVAGGEHGRLDPRRRRPWTWSPGRPARAAAALRRPRRGRAAGPRAVGQARAATAGSRAPSRTGRRRSPPSARRRGRRRASARPWAATRSPRRPDRPGAGAGCRRARRAGAAGPRPRRRAACAAFSAENVKVALTTPAAW